MKTHRGGKQSLGRTREPASRLNQSKENSFIPQPPRYVHSHFLHTLHFFLITITTPRQYNILMPRRLIQCVNTGFICLLNGSIRKKKLSFTSDTVSGVA